MYKLVSLLIILVSLNATQDFISQSYQSQVADQKLDQLWKQIVADTTSNPWPDIGGIFFESMQTSFDETGDVMPSGRQKYIHGQGMVAKVSFVPSDLSKNQYTGMLRGAQNGLIRLSVAKPSDESKTSAKQAFDNFAPGIALKLFRNGKPSANLQAMFGVQGVDTWNFFGRDFSNHIGSGSGVGLRLLAQKFSSATNNVQTVGLRDFATSDEQGNTVNNPKYPWRLIFRAPDKIKRQFTDDFSETLFKQLKKIKKGTTLYNVYAIDDPSKACEVLIGTIVLQSDLTTSRFGDSQLFFKHNQMELDTQDNESWLPYTAVWSFLGWDVDSEQKEGKCPYAHLWQ